jgi:hypothetical protein
MMVRERIIANAPFLFSFNEFVQFFENQYGEIKLKEVFEKVHTSKKCNVFLRQAFERRVRPGTDDYLAVIHSSTSFTFTNAETTSMAAAILLYSWNNSIGMIFRTSDDTYLNKVFFSILDKCDRYKTHISGSKNFFSHFYSHVYDHFESSRFANLQEEFDENLVSDDVSTLEGFESSEEDRWNEFQPSPEEEKRNFLEYYESQRPKKTAPKLKPRQSIIEGSNNKSAYFIRGELYCSSCHIPLDKAHRCQKCRAKYDFYGKRTSM